jgi:transcriptional regulator with XRE-family HTH domain
MSKVVDLRTQGGRLKAARTRARLTQVEAARIAGISQAALSEYETGSTADMMASTLHRLCTATGVTVEYILTGVGIDSDDDEREAGALLRQASPGIRAAAMRALRAILGAELDAGKQPAAS